jgi:recombination protein RecT
MSKEVAKRKPNVAEATLQRVFEKQSQGALRLPENYSAENALMSALLILQGAKTKNEKPVLEACSNASIMSALMNMVTQGLNPAKHQCYFIPYGTTLQMQRSYLGTIAITKRTPGVKDVKGYPVYKTDDFKLGFDLVSGRQTVASYNPGINRNEKDLIGAFAIVIGEDEILHTEWMTMEQIKAAWNMGQTKGGSPAHKGFPDQMAVKTVINRACKTFAMASDDSDLVAGLLADQTDAEVEADISAHANVEMLDMDETEWEAVEEEEVPEGVNPETGEVEPEQGSIFDESTPKDDEVPF